MKTLRRNLQPALALLVLVLSPHAVRAQAGAISPADVAGRAEDPEAVPDVAMVRLDGRPLFPVGGLKTHPAAERARVIGGRIAQAAKDRTASADTLLGTETELGTQIAAGDRPLLIVTDLDARIEHLSRAEAVAIHKMRIRQAIESYRSDRSPERMLKAGLFAAVATAGMLLLLFALAWGTRRVRREVQQLMQGRIGGVKIQSLELVRPEDVRAFVDGTLRSIRIAVVLVVAFLYLDYVLSLFPWSRGVASGMLGYVIDPLRTMGTAFVNYLPSLLFLIVLALVTKLVVSVLRMIASSIEHGLIVLPGFHAEWAVPTYRLVNVAVIAFALVVAFPYIPGSNSPAFQGLSIFAGVLLSLGSSSFIGNIVAGYALLYWRALRVGDLVEIGDTIGVVAETRLMVTHLRTVKNVEVVIPNAALMTGKILNYSSLARESGLVLHTTVGIGYETPWRQVEAMLLIAAERTPGLRKDPKPFVLQRALGDFAVTYEINAYTDNPRGMLLAYHELHRNILDLFNEYGVQIMTPAYEGDPAEAKVVPRDKWHAGPAVPPGADARAPASEPSP